MYLFDTDIITNIFKTVPSRRLLSRLHRTPQEHQHISSITVFEIVYGAWKSNRKEHHLRNLQELLLPTVRVVDFDERSAFVCGAIRAALEKLGTPLALGDLQVASIAIAHDLVLVTGNIGHFQRISRLRVENWL